MNLISTLWTSIETKSAVFVIKHFRNHGVTKNICTVIMLNHISALLAVKVFVFKSFENS